MFNPPSNLKYKKSHKVNLIRKDINSTLAYKSYGLKAIQSGYLTAKQLEAARKAIAKQIKKIGTLHIRVFPYLGLTSKPAETRMGKGKGNVDKWAAPIKSGKIIFEVCNINLQKAKEVLLFGSSKLPLKTRFVSFK